MEESYKAMEESYVLKEVVEVKQEQNYPAQQVLEHICKVLNQN